MAKVTIDNKDHTVHEDKAIYNPIGTAHRLAYQGEIPLELTKVQTGKYLGESDIEQIEDIYRRA